MLLLLLLYWYEIYILENNVGTLSTNWANGKTTKDSAC